jgi:anthranilate phosphoribosyltransferase
LALNAGAALWIYGTSASLKEGVTKAKETLKRGAAMDRLNLWKRKQEVVARSISY